MGKEPAIEYLKAKTKCNKSDIHYFMKFSPNSINPLGRSWVPDHPFVPEGWRIKEVKMGDQSMFRYLSPDGYDLLGKAAALKFLIDKEYPEHEIQQMRETMKYEGWWSEELPLTHWFYRIGNKQVFLISSTGEHFVKMEAALDWVKRHESIKEVNILEDFIRDARAQGYH